MVPANSNVGMRIKCQMWPTNPIIEMRVAINDELAVELAFVWRVFGKMISFN